MAADTTRMDDFFDTVSYVEDRPLKPWREVKGGVDDEPEPVHLSYRARLSLDWDESAHPRDDKGRFGEGGGASEKDTAIDAKHEAFLALAHVGIAQEAILNPLRDELNAAWKAWTHDIQEGRIAGGKKPLKAEGAAAKKLSSYQKAKALEAAFHQQVPEVAHGHFSGGGAG